MKIQLIWTEDFAKNKHNLVLETPIVLGSDVSKLPEEINGITANKAVIQDDNILGYHALIEDNDGQIIIIQQDEGLIYINNIALSSSTLFDGDIIKLGTIEIQIKLGKNIVENGCINQVGFLIKRRCGKPILEGSQYCSFCQNKPNPYESDYNYYPNYGYYNRYDSWGYNYYSHRRNHVEFTEADGRAFDEERDNDFEQNMGAS
jgi:hypothetical protein